jgi:hypothetical protein
VTADRWKDWVEHVRGAEDNIVSRRNVSFDHDSSSSEYSGDSGESDGHCMRRIDLH